MIRRRPHSIALVLFAIPLAALLASGCARRDPPRELWFYCATNLADPARVSRLLLVSPAQPIAPGGMLDRGALKYFGARLPPFSAHLVDHITQGDGMAVHLGQPFNKANFIRGLVGLFGQCGGHRLAQSLRGMSGSIPGDVPELIRI